MFLIPPLLMIWMVGSLIIPFLFVTWVISCMRKREALLTTLALASVVALKSLESTMPPPDDMVLYGVRNRIMHDAGVNTIRDFARAFDRLPVLANDNTNFGTKLYYQDDFAKTDFPKRYPFLNWARGPQLGSALLASTKTREMFLSHGRADRRAIGGLTYRSTARKCRLPASLKKEFT